MTVRWNTKLESVFASGSLDRRILVWDLSKIGNPQSVSDTEDGPPELLVIKFYYNIIIFNLNFIKLYN